MDKGSAPRRRLRRFLESRKSGERTAPQQAAATPTPSTPSWSESGELPELHDRTRVVLMAVSPYLVHAYWDLDSKTQADAAGATLRFHDSTAGQPPSSFDIPVNLATKSWYVHLWGPARHYTAELGLNGAEGFVSLARSNSLETPRAWPVAEIQERFARVGETRAAVEPAPPAKAAAPHPAAPPKEHLMPAAMPPMSPAEAPRAPFAPPTRSAAPPTPRAVPTPPEQAIRLPEQPPQAAGPAGPPAPSIPPPVNAAEVLRSRLMELYANRWWRGRPAGVPASVDPEEILLERQLGVSDSTGQAESHFAPGFSSSLLGLGSSKERTG